MARIAGEKASFKKNDDEDLTGRWGYVIIDDVEEDIVEAWDAFHKKDEEVHNQVAVTETGKIVYGDTWHDLVDVIYNPDGEKRRRVPLQSEDSGKIAREIMKEAAEIYDDADYWEIGTSVRQAVEKLEVY